MGNVHTAKTILPITVFFCGLFAWAQQPGAGTSRSAVPPSSGGQPTEPAERATPSAPRSSTPPPAAPAPSANSEVATGALPPPNSGEGRTILAIEFAEAQPLAKEDLDRALPLHVGEPLKLTDAARAIDVLFATGRFTDLAVETELRPNGVIVRFLNTNASFIGGITVLGAPLDSPNRGESTSAVQLNIGQPFEEEDVQRGVDNLKKLLESNGLFKAEVTAEQHREEHAQQVFLTFRISPGPRARYGMPLVEDESNAKDVSISDNTLLRITGWRIPIIHWWRKVTASRTQRGVAAIQRRYQSRDHLMARVDLVNVDYNAATNRARPDLRVNPGPKVNVKALESGVSRRVLRRYVPIFQETAVDNDLLVEGQRNLRDYLQSKGYYDADVDFRVEPQEDDQMTIDYVISRGMRYKMVRLDIVGNNYFATSTIRERMFMEPASFTVRHGRFSDAFRRRDEENIANLYASNGFRDTQVTTTVQRAYRGKPADVAVRVRIIEGPQYIVDNLEVRGSSHVGDLTSMLMSSAGQPFSEINMAADREFILTRLFEEGYPEASFMANWSNSSTPHHVNIVYTIQEGRRQFVREVIVSGLSTTRPTLIQRYITLKPGDPLSPVRQSLIQQSFYNLGVFSRISTAVENPDGDTEHKFVLYHFEEANRYLLTFGVGAQVGRFGTPSATDLSAPAGSTGFSPEFSVNVTRLNFLGLGHTVSLLTNYSTLQERAVLQYQQPRFRNREGRNITYSLLYDDTRDVRTFASKREEGSVQISQRFNRSISALFQFAYRRVSVSDVVIPALLIPQLVQPVRIGITSFSLVQDRRDNAANARRGIYDTIDLGIASKYFGSQRSFGKILLRNATYHPITRNIVFARQTQFGLIQPFSIASGLTASEDIPLPERFFGGGADSLRAFPYNQAGPRDIGAPTSAGQPASQPTGFPLGGNALLFNTVELRFPLIGQNIGGVIFHDMGNIYSTPGDISFRVIQRNNQDFNYMVHAVGFGVRYQTPVGPVRVDLAYSINPPSFVGFKGTPDQLIQCNPNLPPSSLPSYCQGVPQGISHFQFFFSIGQTF